MVLGIWIKTIEMNNMESKMSLVLSPYEGCHYVSSLSYPWLKAKSFNPLWSRYTYMCI